MPGRGTLRYRDTLAWSSRLCVPVLSLQYLFVSHSTDRSLGLSLNFSSVKWEYNVPSSESCFGLVEVSKEIRGFLSDCWLCWPFVALCWLFSSCGEIWLPPCLAHRRLTAGALCFRARAQGSGVPAGCSLRALWCSLQLGHAGLGCPALWALLIGNQTHVPRISGPILTTGTAREVLEQLHWVMPTLLTHVDQSTWVDYRGHSLEVLSS